MSTLRHINISDLHISIYKETEDYFEELQDIIRYIDRIRDNLDILTIAGDLFDRVYPANHKAIQMAVEFIKLLINRARAYNFIIFVLQGTVSHDSTQLDIFSALEEDNLFYVIKDVTYMDIQGLIFRFIPEYYSNTYEELFDKAFLNKADVTVFHGTIKSAMPYAKSLKCDIVKNAQVLEDDDLVLTTGLYTVGGHIHNRKFVKPNIWYTGSYSSKSFSDAGTKKGFDDIEINLDTYTYRVNFVENRKCRKYQVIDCTDICKNTIKKQQAYFNALKLDMGKYDIIRIDVNTNTYTDDEYKNLAFIMSSYKGVFKFKIERQVMVTQAKESIVEDAEYVLSPTIPLTVKIQKTIEEIYDTTMEMDRIKEILELPIGSEKPVFEEHESEKTNES